MKLGAGRAIGCAAAVAVALGVSACGGPAAPLAAIGQPVGAAVSSEPDVFPGHRPGRTQPSPPPKVAAAQGRHAQGCRAQTGLQARSSPGSPARTRGHPQADHHDTGAGTRPVPVQLHLQAAGRRQVLHPVHAEPPAGLTGALPRDDMDGQHVGGNRCRLNYALHVAALVQIRSRTRPRLLRAQTRVAGLAVPQARPIILTAAPSGGQRPCPTSREREFVVGCPCRVQQAPRSRSSPAPEGRSRRYRQGVTG
jgi:hypothetical protein